MRSSATPTGGLTAIVAAVALGMGGCGLGGDNGAERAADAATTYLEEIATLAEELEAAEGKRKELAGTLADPPELEAVESDEASYTQTQELAARIEPMLEELRLLAELDIQRENRLAEKLFSLANEEATAVFRRSTQGGLVPKVTATILEEGRSAGRELEHRLDLRAMAGELEAWQRYRRRVANVSVDASPLFVSMLDYELGEIDYTLALYESYREHLREFGPGRADLGYYDRLWTDEDPRRFLPMGVFSSVGDPYIRSLQEGRRIITSLVRGIGELAKVGEVGAGAPSVGDAYRDAIVAGFVSPLAKDKFRTYKVGYRAWMLHRIRELEETPDETYEPAMDTLVLELTGDSRTAYERLLAGFDGLKLLVVTSPSDLPAVRTHLELMSEELAGPFPPILEGTRVDFLTALEAIDLEALERGYEKPGKGLSISEELEQSIQAIRASDRGRDSYFEALKRVEAVLRSGAKIVDSPKELRRALERTLTATRPS